MNRASTTGANGRYSVDEAPAGPNGDLVNLFERARLALTTRLQLEPGIAQALALPRGAAQVSGSSPAGGRSIAAQLYVDERTRRVMVRLIDTRTGASIRELPPVALAALAARIGRPVAQAKR